MGTSSGIFEPPSMGLLFLDLNDTLWKVEDFPSECVQMSPYVHCSLSASGLGPVGFGFLNTEPHRVFGALNPLRSGYVEHDPNWFVPLKCTAHPWGSFPVVYRRKCLGPRMAGWMDGSRFWSQRQQVYRGNMYQDKMYQPLISIDHVPIHVGTAMYERNIYIYIYFTDMIRSCIVILPKRWRDAVWNAEKT